MAVNVYLTLDGNCREAVEFYAKVFNVEVPQIMTFGEGPKNPDYPMPEEAKDRVMHARLTINGSDVMFSDNWPGQPYVEGNNITLAFVSDDVEAIRSAYEGLQEGGTVELELQETFWSKSYGQVKDKFGIGWQLSHESKE